MHAYLHTLTLDKILTMNGHHPFTTMFVLCCAYGVNIIFHPKFQGLKKFCGKTFLAEITNASTIDLI
jgi:hypothetical protein